MKGILVRIGIDSTYGKWNAPVDPDTLEYYYLPIPENQKHQIKQGMERPYSNVIPSLKSFSKKNGLDLYSDLHFPRELETRNMHLDPDFDFLTYGDNGERRGKGVSELDEGDFIAFYASLRPIKPYSQKLMYVLIGFFEVMSIQWAKNISIVDWDKNAHTRKKKIHANDIIIFANPNNSGRFTKCIPIGEYRDKAYRVTKPILEKWGGLKIQDGYIQRSGNPPFFKNPKQFLSWLTETKPRLLQSNF